MYWYVPWFGGVNRCLSDNELTVNEVSLGEAGLRETRHRRSKANGDCSRRLPSSESAKQRQSSEKKKKRPLPAFYFFLRCGIALKICKERRKSLLNLNNRFVSFFYVMILNVLICTLPLCPQALTIKRLSIKK